MKQELKLLLDENIGLKVYRKLQSQGYHVQSVITERRGASDEEVIKTAISRGKVIITMDKDFYFGYLAQAYRPPGIVILKLRDPRIPFTCTVPSCIKLCQSMSGTVGFITAFFRPDHPAGAVLPSGNRGTSRSSSASLFIGFKPNDDECRETLISLTSHTYHRCMRWLERLLKYLMSFGESLKFMLLRGLVIMALLRRLLGRRLNYG